MMGLDMYLNARRHTSEYMDKEANLELRPLADKLLPPAAQDYDSIEIQRQVAYWRKANHIHRWFVENVQSGEDDCGEYAVSLEQLKELRDLCEKVLKTAKLKDDTINNGWTYQGGQKVAITEPGKVITNPEAIEALLPTQAGFFFGGTDYDEWYLNDVKETVDQIERILGWAAGHMRGEPGQQYCPVSFTYQSSW
jgi:hypothetical protein